MIAAGHFPYNVVDHLGSPAGMQFRLHAAQRDTYDVTMMQLGARTFAAQLQPDAVYQVDILRPEARRVRPQVDEHDIFLVLEDDLERKRRARLGKMFPVPP